MKRYSIATVPGDGSGKEVMPEGVCKTRIETL